ncbi:MAG: hypothetical protein WBA57_08680 [Elainellaceae cyanobacterium]
MNKSYLINLLGEAIAQLQSAKELFESGDAAAPYRLNEGVGLANYSRRVAKMLGLLENLNP